MSSIHLVDTHYMRPQAAAAYLLIHEGEAAFVETNTTHAVPRLLEALASHGLSPDAVRWVIVTHVHLDHAGGAGALLRQLPEARLVVHPSGARHLVDPTRLVAGATAVYGAEAVASLYGEVVPAPEARVHPSSHGEALPLGGQELLLLHTPGHARHHLCVLDPLTHGAFTGDLLGIGYPALRTPGGPLVYPTTAPPQLDPPAMRESIRLLLDQGVERLHLTHFGAVDEVEQAVSQVLGFLDEWEAAALRLAARHPPGEARHQALSEALRDSLVQRYRALGGSLPQPTLEAWLRLDVEINTQGWEVWLARTAKDRS